MSALVDMPLEELVRTRQHPRGGRPFSRGRGRARRGSFSGHEQNVNKGAFTQRGGGRGGKGLKTSGAHTNAAANGVPRKVSDLRDVIVKKTKAHVTDLRLKLHTKPPAPPPRTKGTPQRQQQPSRGRNSGKDPRAYPPQPPPPQRHQGGRRSPSPLQYQPKPHSSPGHSGRLLLPTLAEAKKITVTVPGLSKTTSEVYRREERLAASIIRQRESRQQSYMKSREQFIATTITSALGEGDRERDRDRERERERPPPVYHRPYRSPSPPPPPSYHNHHHSHQFEHEYIEPRPMVSMATANPPRGRGLTTVTTMTISNLNDTVSKVDIFELCNAIGPVEGVNIPTPGLAEVTFRFKDDALEAFRKYNQRNLDGQAMICHLHSGGAGSRTRPSMGYRMPHDDMYAPDTGYAHTRSYYS